MKDRIGTLNADGSVKEYPALSLAGFPYEKTQDRIGISRTQFVILDRFLSADARDKLLAEIAPASGKVAPVVTDDKDGNVG